MESFRPLPDGKTAVLVLSTMRSGSTLLKALLSSAPDVAQLPEVDFQKFRGPEAADRMAALAPEPILLLKRPAWFNETRRYPALPEISGIKCIILARDVHTNTLSLRKMVLRKWAPLAPACLDQWIARRYWTPVYSRLHSQFPHHDPSTYWIRYEDLASDPIRHTQALFRFMGSCQEHGIDSYDKPRSYEWRWGSDDGGPKIKSLTVHATSTNPQAERILASLSGLPAVQSARASLGYR